MLPDKGISNSLACAGVEQAKRLAGAACNRLLNSLPTASRKRLESVQEAIVLSAGDVIHQHDKPVTHAVFPCGGLISLLMKDNGKWVEIATAGSEGLFGLPLFFGVDVCPMTATVHVPGNAIRFPAPDFRVLVETDRPLAAVLGRYAQAFSIMTAQGAVCHSSHTVEERCARWLLTAHDRLAADEFPLTQVVLAQMLGVQRQTVSEVAERMRRQNLIRYRRGRMRILDRHGLEQRACRCYGVIAREFERLLDFPPKRSA